MRAIAKPLGQNSQNHEPISLSNRKHLLRMPYRRIKDTITWIKAMTETDNAICLGCYFSLYPFRYWFHGSLCGQESKALPTQNRRGSSASYPRHSSVRATRKPTWLPGFRERPCHEVRSGATPELVNPSNYRCVRREICNYRPRSTANHRRCVVIIIVPTILDPLPDIPDHVVKSELIGWIGPNRGRLLAIPLAAAAFTIGIVLTNLITPGINRLHPGPRRIFVFSFREQSIVFSGHL